MSGTSLAKQYWYDFLQLACRLATVVLFQIRCEGRKFVPRTGGALLLSNHQSHLDPVLVGVACDRRLSYLARDTLFGFAPFRWLIQSVNAIPIDREGGGLAGLKETLRRLKQGEVVAIFPEGTRTMDGEMRPLKPGFCTLARRAKVPLVPLAIEGAFQAWPRSALAPKPGVIRIRFGEPLWPDQIANMEDCALVAEMASRIRACHDLARQQRQRTVPS